MTNRNDQRRMGLWVPITLVISIVTGAVGYGEMRSTVAEHSRTLHTVAEHREIDQSFKQQVLADLAMIKYALGLPGALEVPNDPSIDPKSSDPRRGADGVR